MSGEKQLGYIVIYLAAKTRSQRTLGGLKLILGYMLTARKAGKRKDMDNQEAFHAKLVKFLDSQNAPYELTDFVKVVADFSYTYGLWQGALTAIKKQAKSKQEELSRL